MKKLLVSTFALFIFYSSFFIPPVQANYNSSLSTYNASYTQYREAYSRFVVAKSAYQTYRTLVSQNNAVATFKDVLRARNTLMGDYFDLLYEKLSSTTGVDPLDKTVYSEIRTNTKDWIASNQGEITNAGTLPDLNSASDKFAQRYPQMLKESQQTLGRVILPKGTNLDKKLSAQFDAMAILLATISSEGEDAAQMQRGLIQARSKRDLFLQKQDQVRLTFFPDQRYYSNQKIDILSGQQQAIEANQYLKESVNFLLEIIKSITG